MQLARSELAAAWGHNRPSVRDMSLACTSSKPPASDVCWMLPCSPCSLCSGRIAPSATHTAISLSARVCLIDMHAGVPASGRAGGARAKGLSDERLERQMARQGHWPDRCCRRA